MTWLISDEARKHRAFREVWVAYLLGGLYLLLGSYSWVFPYLWSDVWKPVLLEIGMILLEFFIFWRIWRRKATT